MRSNLLGMCSAVAAVAVVCSAHASNIVSLNLDDAFYQWENWSGPQPVTKNQTVAGRSGVSTINNALNGVNLIGYAGSAFNPPGMGDWMPANFGMQSTAWQGTNPNGWAEGAGALLSDVLGVSFDYYVHSGSMVNVSLAMYVFGPENDPNNEGYLLFDLGTLPMPSEGQWASTGNFLASGAGINAARYQIGYSGSQQFSGHKSFQEILGLLPNWSVYSIQINMWDANNVVSIDNFTVNSVPAPGAIALLGAAGLVARRRKA